MATKVILYCPSIDKTEKDFTIGPLRKHGHLLQDIRWVFGLNYAAVYDIRAQPIENLRDCILGQIVQVSAAESERMKRYSSWNCIMYNGEEGADVFWLTDGVGLSWEVRNS